jgi:hypothetical protein
MSEDNKIKEFPPQRIPNSKKTKKWREDCIRYAENVSVLSNSSVRMNKINIRRNYRLFGGKLDMRDVEQILNPEGIDYGVETQKIQHYPILNSKIDILLGEERNSIIEDRVVISNPSAISEIEEAKIQEIKNRLQADIVDETMSEEERQMRLQEFDLTFNYDYQDLREKNLNELLNHYKTEYNFPAMFNEGYMDALVAKTECYYCYIECGEPKVERVNLQELSFWGSKSNRIEDYPYVVRERYMSANNILDIWGDQMSDADYRKFDRLIRGEFEGNNLYVSEDYYHFRYGDNPTFVDSQGYFKFDDDTDISELPYDIGSGIRVLEVFWKSMSQVLAVHYYDEDGNKQVKFRTPGYIPDEDAGETVKKYWKNEAWHGVMIGAGKDAIFVDVGPCQVQYNRLGNPSKCHFGFVGTIYNNNDYEGMSAVDKLKPLSYQYDVVMAKLNELIARNYGKLTVVDFARVPAGWEVEKWAYFLKLGIFAIDSMKEGSIGAAKGKLAGGVANTPLTADAELGSSILNYVQLLMNIDASMEKMLGLTPQRMGSVKNRETVGGVERAVAQSSNVTYSMSSKHDDLKIRVEWVFLETAKIAMRGKTKKFPYILSDGSIRHVMLDGNEVSELDLGMVLMNGYDVQSMQQSIDLLAQAKMQNNLLSASAYMELKRMTSISEKIKLLKREEARMRQEAQQAQQQQLQTQQMEIQMKMQLEQQKLRLEEQNNIRDNETKILVAQITAQNSIELQSLQKEANGDNSIENEKLRNEMEKFNREMDLEKEKIASQERMNSDNNDVKKQIARMKPQKTSQK